MPWEREWDSLGQSEIGNPLDSSPPFDGIRMDTRGPMNSREKSFRKKWETRSRGRMNMKKGGDVDVRRQRCDPLPENWVWVITRLEGLGDSEGIKDS